jgi:hypothetical protein
LAKNRYGWEKRAKEMARKHKHDEKIKRRQGKISDSPEASPQEASEGSEAPEVIIGLDAPVEAGTNDEEKI